MGTTFYEEILERLSQNKVTKYQETQYLSWVEKIGKSRIDHIVSIQHRRAYERAAQVLGSLAEIYAASGKKARRTNYCRHIIVKNITGSAHFEGR